jgi:hypothetical protein
MPGWGGAREKRQVAHGAVRGEEPGGQGREREVQRVQIGGWEGRRGRVMVVVVVVVVDFGGNGFVNSFWFGTANNDGAAGRSSCSYKPGGSGVLKSWRPG